MKLLKVVCLFAFASAAMSAKPVEGSRLKRRNVPHPPNYEIGNPNHVANLKTVTDKAAATCFSYSHTRGLSETDDGWTTGSVVVETCDPDHICMDLYVSFEHKTDSTYWELKDGLCVPAEFTCKNVEWVAGQIGVPAHEYHLYDYTAYGCATCDTDNCNNGDGIDSDPDSVPTQAINCHFWHELAATADGTFSPVTYPDGGEYESGDEFVYPCADEFAETGKCMSIFYNYTDSNGDKVYARQAGCVEPGTTCSNIQSFVDQDVSGDVSELPNLQDKSQSVVFVSGCNSCTGDVCDLDVAVDDFSALPDQEEYSPPDDDSTTSDDDSTTSDDDSTSSSSKVFSAPALAIAALTAALVI